jgi:hypothetical protein
MVDTSTSLKLTENVIRVEKQEQSSVDKTFLKATIRDTGREKGGCYWNIYQKTDCDEVEYRGLPRDGIQWQAS